MGEEEFEVREYVIEYEKAGTEHVCWDCKHLKPVTKGSELPPDDLIGWCKKVHWPFFWCVSEDDIITECYAFEPKEE